MAGRVVHVNWTSAETNRFKALSQCDLWIRMCEIMSQVIPNFTHILPMLRVVCNCRRCEKCAEPLKFWTKNGTATTLIRDTFQEIADERILFTLLLIDFAWDFRQLKPWHEFTSRRIRKYGCSEHMFLSDWCEILGESFSANIPDSRLKSIEETRKNGTKLVANIMAKHEAREKDTLQAKKKRSKSKSRWATASPAILRKYCCTICGAMTTPDPIRCLYINDEEASEGAYVFTHFSCSAHSLRENY